MLKSEDLQHFIQVAKHQGFSAAAKATGTDVGALSRAVARLESELNCSLFQRTTRKVALTPEGTIFLADVKASQETLQNAQEKIKNLKNTPFGKLRVNAASPFVMHALSPLIKPFLARYPDIELALTCDENIIDLLEKKTDVAIRIGSLEDSTLKTRLIGRSPLHLVASPEYLKNFTTPQTPQDLVNHQYIGFQNAPDLNVLRFDDAPALTPCIEASNGEVIRQLCLHGNGFAYLSNFMIHEDIAAGRLIPFLQEHTRQPNDRELIQAVFTTPPSCPLAPGLL